MNDATLRTLGASATVLAYAALCLAVFWRERRRTLQQRRKAAELAGDDGAAATLVLFGSQTGQAEAIAWETAGWLRDSGEAARVLSLNETGPADLQQARRALFIASTYGEGDAPDGASVFFESLMGAVSAPLLPALRYSVLALGDRQYQHFCGFGRALDTWLARAGATREHARLEVDNSDAQALATWRTQIGGGAAPDSTSPEPVPWRLTARELMNPGSAGTPVFHLAFAPLDGIAPHWESGDLAQLTVPEDPTRPRDYSIASIPGDGSLHLLVRQEQHADGSLGTASGLLTSTLAVGDSLPLRLRPHRAFRLGENATRPLILIGNGTGIAGLRSHLRERARSGRRENWLIFGERNVQHDRLYGAEIEAWHHSGVLERVDWVFSRDQAERLYVQHRLREAKSEVLTWLARGAAIYVCGSLQGMASGVDTALRQITGEAALRELSATGRYRRDVY
jgi:sulfite reductase (NADPH) flavoprotein alpha-component